MTWTYNPSASPSDKDKVRVEVQDTDANAPLLEDEEIAYALADEAGPVTPATPHGIFSAAARCCEWLARRFAAQADTMIGSLQTTYSQAAKGYADQANALRAKAAGMGAPYVGGQSWSEKESREANGDQVQPRFSRSQFRNGMAGPLDRSGRC